MTCRHYGQQHRLYRTGNGVVRALAGRHSILQELRGNHRIPRHFQTLELLRIKWLTTSSVPAACLGGIHDDGPVRRDGRWFD